MPIPESEKIVRVILQRPSTGSVAPPVSAGGPPAYELWSNVVNFGDIQSLHAVEKVYCRCQSISPISRVSAPGADIIVTGANNNIYVSTAGAGATGSKYTLTANTYTPASLCTALTSLLYDITPGTDFIYVVVTFVNNYFVFTCTGPANKPLTLDFSQVSENLAEVLGFEPGGTYTATVTSNTAVSVLVSPNPTSYAQLPQEPSGLKVQIDVVSMDGYDAGTKGRPNTVAYMEPQLINSQFADRLLYFQGNQSFGNFTVPRMDTNSVVWTVKITDLSGEVLWVPVGFVYEICLELSF